MRKIGARANGKTGGKDSHDDPSPKGGEHLISEYRPEYDGNPSCAACGTIMVRVGHILGWQCKSCGSTEPDPATPAPKIEAAIPVMDFPEAWAFVRTTALDDHHIKCSWRSGMLCDCNVLWAEYYKRKCARAESEVRELKEQRDQFKQNWADCIDQRNLIETALSMAVDRLGGIVEGNPTGRHNFLQRIDELIQKEAALARMGQAVTDEEWGMIATGFTTKSWRRAIDRIFASRRAKEQN